MGCGTSAPGVPDVAGPLVPVPWPERTNDLWHWDDKQLMNALRYIVLRLDDKTAERNPRMQDKAEDLKRKGVAGRDGADGDPPTAFRGRMAVVSSALVAHDSLPQHGVDPLSVRGLPSWWPSEHVLRVDRPLEELRDSLAFLQARSAGSSKRRRLREHSEHAALVRGCLPCASCCKPARDLEGERMRQVAMRARAEALVWHGRAILHESSVRAAARASTRRVAAGLLLPLPPYETLRLLRLFADIDLLSKGFVTLRDFRRDISTLANSSMCKSALFPVVMKLSLPRRADRLRYDEFAWTIHNLCVASDSELVQMCFAELTGTTRLEGEPAIDLDDFEAQHKALLRGDAPGDDVALRKEVLGLRERRKAFLSAARYQAFGKWYMLEDLVQACAAQPVLLLSARALREFWQRRTFGQRFWERRRKQLTAAITRGKTLLAGGRSPVQIAHAPDHAGALPKDDMKPASREADVLRKHPAVFLRLPRLRPLVEAQARLRDHGHGLPGSRPATAVIAGSPSTMELLTTLKRVLPPGDLERRRKAASNENGKFPSRGSSTVTDDDRDLTHANDTNARQGTTTNAGTLRPDQAAVSGSAQPLPRRVAGDPFPTLPVQSPVLARRDPRSSIAETVVFGSPSAGLPRMPSVYRLAGKAGGAPVRGSDDDIRTAQEQQVSSRGLRRAGSSMRLASARM